MENLIERLKELAEYAEPREWDLPLDLADVLRVAAEELEKRRWIPVEEKLPEGVQSVLVRRKDGGIFLWEYCPYSPTDDIWVDEHSNVFSVYDTTHWMPLPEALEEDKV